MDNLLLQALDKYGPLGAALVVLCLVLWLFISRVLPAVIETMGKRLDGVVSRQELYERAANMRHGVVMDELKDIGERIG